ncbi:MAG: methionyl-tRNA formyltransferase [Planctomycetes bacterium]|nr:methionyl-tRNA formyltransferase [Planctomycetota bacterium]
MKIVYLGSGEFGIDCLNALADSEHNLDLVITGAAHQAGRGRKFKSTPVASWAEKHSIDFIETEDVNAPQIIEKIASYEPDLIVVIAFGQKLSNELIAVPKKGAINVHASLLPKYRGAAPINWAIINGEKQTGISIITLAEKMDAGEILGQEKTEILADETAGTLHDRLAKLSAPLLLKTIKQIDDGSAVYTKQDVSQVTRAHKLKKSDGFIDFTDSAEQIQKKILGFWPWPGASVFYVSKKTTRCRRVTLGMAEVVESSNPADLATGILDENLNIICGKNALKVTKIKPADGTLMEFEDFVNGRQSCPGDLFMKIDE